ncbi:hypothetical protein KQI84_16525 [bacterium]|nr:hypothetical protein [bacterium]
MKPKAIITAALLLFVGISLAAIVVKEMRSEPAPIESTATVQTKTEAQSTNEPIKALEETHFVVYYFHGNVRCTTCNAIEKQSRDAISTMFADQLDAGDMEWRLVNYDEPENTHFRDDFELAFQSVILTEERGDTILRWKNLPDIWTKIHETPQEFEEYVVENTVDFMAGDES